MAAGYDESLRTPIVWHPRDAAEAWQFKHIAGPDSSFVAGGTLLRTQWETGVSRLPKHLIDLCSIHGIKGISISAQGLTIGAVTTLAVIRRDPLIAAHFPLLTDAVRSVAAPSVRNLATLGGNVVSRIGDALPALLVYDAELIWHDGHKTSVQPLSGWLEEIEAGIIENDRLLLQVRLPIETEDDMWTEGQERKSKGLSDSSAEPKQDSAPSEMPASETVEPMRDSVTPRSGGTPDNSRSESKRVFGRYQKVGRRETFTPSVVTAAFLYAADASGRIDWIRIAAGGGQTVPRRLYGAEALAKGRKGSPDLLGLLYERIAQDFEPRGDFFASAAYRKQTAANVITAEMWRQLRMV